MKNWKVENKIRGGFFSILFLIFGLSAIFISIFSTINNNYAHLIDYTSNGQQLLLKANADILNMRRMVSMVHAFAGDVDRINNFHDEFNRSYAATNDRLDAYLTLVNADP